MNNPYYFVLGFIMRASHSDPMMLVCVMSLILTGLIFLGLVCLYSIFLSETVAAFGCILSVTFWVLTLLDRWQTMYWFPFAESIYPYGIIVYVGIPMLFASLMIFIRSPTKSWSHLSLWMAVPCSFMHPMFVLYTPVIVGFSSLVSGVLNPLKEERRETMIHFFKAFVLGLVSLSVSYLGTQTGKEGEPATAASQLEWWRAGGSVWYVNDSFYAASFSKWFMEAGGWLTILGFVGMILLIFLYKIPQKNKTLIGLTAPSLAPFLLGFNPVLAPVILKLGRSAVPLYRVGEVSSTFFTPLPFMVVAGLVAYLVKWKWFPRKISPFVFLLSILLSVMLPLQVTSWREAVWKTFSNYGWGVPILDTRFDSLFRHFRQLPYGHVAAATPYDFQTAAFTQHDPIGIEFSYIGDYAELPRRLAATKKLTEFNGELDEILKTIQEFDCRYIIVPQGSFAANRYRSFPEFFKLAVNGDSHIVFSYEGRYGARDF